MTKLILVSLAAIAGFICYSVAKKRGLQYPILWFVGGVIFHVFAIAAVLYAAKYVSRRKKGVVS